jgi:hypothetical protein
MGGQKVTRRQKDISRLLREKKKLQPLKHKRSKVYREKIRNAE